jgi:NADH-quinone oxidoreductase subunit M
MSTALLAVTEGTSTVSFPVLPSLVAIPAVGAVVVALISHRRPDALKAVALLFSTAAGAISIWMLVEFDKHDPGFQFVSQHSWIKSLGISWLAGVDGISLFLVVLTAVMFPLVIFGVEPEHDPKPYYAWLLLLEAGCIGAFIALDLFLFFVMFEVVLVPMYFLIAQWGHGRRVYSATKFFIYTMAGSAFLLVGIVSLAVLNARGTGGDLTFNVVEIANSQSLATVTARWLFLAFAVAFAVKTPIFPLHTWLPDAHTEAPTAGSVILAAIMLKLGTYGFIRFGLYLFPEPSVYFAPLFITLGTIGIIYGAIVATMQRDLKRLVAYSSVAHLGFIIFGIFSLNREAIEGAVLQMINHGLSTGALFLLVGMIYERRHTREIASLTGLQKAAPVMAGVFTLVMLSSIGLPGLNGFVGEFLILLGGFMAHRWWATVAATGVILAALYLLWAYQRVFHGTPDGENAKMPDLRLRESMVMAPLVALIVFLGVYPKPVLERMEPSIDALLVHIEDHVPRFHEPTPQRSGNEVPEEAGGAASGESEGGH